MGWQEVSAWQILLAATVADNGAPTGDQAGRLVMTALQPFSVEYMLRIQLTGVGAITAEYFLWGRDVEDSIWGLLGENDGQLNNAVAIAGTTEEVRYFELQNLGQFKDLWLS